MGIELWQLRVPHAAEADSAQPQILAETTADKTTFDSLQQPPLLVAQLQRAIEYCQGYQDPSSGLSWKIEPSLEQIELNDTELFLPELTKVFASAKLKQQLWQLIHQRPN